MRALVDRVARTQGRRPREPGTRRTHRSHPRNRSRRRVHDQLPDRPVLAPAPASTGMAHDPVAACGPVPHHPGRAHRHGAGHRPAPARQAVVGLPTALPVATGARPRPRHRAGHARTARLRLGVHALHRYRQRRSLVPLGLLLHQRPLLGGMDHHRRIGRPHRRQAHNHPLRALADATARRARLPSPNLARRI